MIAGFIIFLAYQVCSATDPLGNYNADIDTVTLSGFSGGAAFTMQMHVAMSASIKGAGMFAGWAYGCTLYESYDFACAQNSAESNLDVLEAKAEELAQAGKIDSLTNLQGSKVYVQGGASDKIVYQSVAQKSAELYQRFGANLSQEFTLDTGHGIPTVDFGDDSCDAGEDIMKCNYAGAETVLRHVYGSLGSSVEQKAANLLYYDQSEFFNSNQNMDDKGMIYVPDGCKNSSGCKLHVHFHGCGANLNVVGDYFTKNAGYNQVAEANNIIILYPQTKTDCFDVDGRYKNGDQHITKDGEQIKRMWNMVKRICGQEIADYWTDEDFQMQMVIVPIFIIINIIF